MEIILLTLLFALTVFSFSTQISSIKAIIVNNHPGNSKGMVIITQDIGNSIKMGMPGLSDFKKIFLYKTFYEIADTST